MAKQEDAALKQATVTFVQEIITEVYGQSTTRASVAAIAKRVMDTLPRNGSASPSTGNGVGRGVVGRSKG